MLPSESCSNALIKNCSKIKNRNVKKQISEKAVFFLFSCIRLAIEGHHGTLVLEYPKLCYTANYL